MDRRLIFGIIIAIIIIIGLGAYAGTQNQENVQLNLANVSNGTADSSSINSSANQNSNNQVNANSSKQTVNAQKIICTACHGTGWDYCMGCHGTGLESCAVCGGDGKLKIYNIKTKQYMIVPCSNCGGDGKITCTICGGSGVKPNAVLVVVMVT